MQSIFTKYLGPTNVRGSRVKAWASGWSDRKSPSVTLSWDNSLNADQNHRRAAEMLAKKLDWSGTWYEGAAEKGNGNVYVCGTDDYFWIAGFVSNSVTRHRAAAPELLKALRSLEAMAKAKGGLNAYELQDMAKIARFAIAKATGEQN